MTTDKGDAWYVANAKKNNFSCLVKTHASKSAPFADQNYDYVPNYTTHVDHIKCVGVSGSTAKPITPVTPSAPTKPWDAAAANEAALIQVKTFGSHKAGLTGAIKACDIGAATIQTGKYEKKSSALDKALQIAFTPDGSHNKVMAEFDMNTLEGAPNVIEGEEENETEALIIQAKAALSIDQWAMVVAKANGKTQKEIAAEMGITHQAVSLKFKTIHKKVLKKTGVVCVG